MGDVLKDVGTTPTTPDDNIDDYGNGVDRISGLPDHILCHILSFLHSTKEAAVTSMLSTRWRYLFVSLPDIDLEFGKRPMPYVASEIQRNDNDRQRFFDFVSLGFRAFLLRNGAPIRRFKLYLWSVHESFRSSLDLMISAALLCEVQQLEIFVGRKCYTVQLTTPGIFTCKTLVFLKLLQLGDLDVPDLVVLPNRKLLHLQCKKLAGDSVRRLIQGCPILEEMSLDFWSFSCEDEDTTKVEIFYFSSPSMRKLRINFWGGNFTVVVDSVNLERLDYIVQAYHGEHKVIIDAPNLEYLAYFAPAEGVNFIRNLNSLVQARIGVGWLNGQLRSQDAIDHLNRVQKVKLLGLREHILEAVYNSQHLLPTFENLTTLELQAVCYSGGVDHILSWKVLPSLFKKASNLEAIFFDQVVLENITESKELESLFLEVFPICFIKNLKEIKIGKFNREEYEFKLVEYLLQNGKALKKVTIGIFLEPSVCKRILSFKRCSKECRIVLHRANC